MKWLALAGLLFGSEVLLGLLTVGLGDEPDGPVDAYVGNAVFALTLLSIPVAMGLAITRYRLYDVDRVISRALTYGALTVAVVVGYSAVLAVVIRPLVADTTAATVVGLGVAALVAAATAPVRSRLLERTERWVYGERADRYETMRTLAADLAAEPSPEAVLARIAEAAAGAARARGVRVTLDVPGGAPVGATWGRVQPAAAGDGEHGEREGLGMTVALVVDGERVGEVRLTTPSGRAEDVALLDDVLDLAAPVVHNILATARLDALGATLRQQNRDLAESRTLLARAAEAERAALQRVIEVELLPRIDRVGHELPEPGCPPSPDLRARYDRLAAESRILAADIRGLAHSVLPPLLVDRGLVPALRALARESTLDVAVEAESPAPTDRLPADLETAVFLACREAMRSLTSRATLTVGRCDGHLSLTLAGPGGGPVGHALPPALGRVIALGGRAELRDEGSERTFSAAVPVPSS